VDAILLDSMSGDLASQAVKLANDPNIPIVMISISPPKDDHEKESSRKPTHICSVAYIGWKAIGTHSYVALRTFPEV
jgi:hypothetical protein